MPVLSTGRKVLNPLNAKMQRLEGTGMPVLSIGRKVLNPLNAELNPIYHLLALLGAHYILHVSRIRVKG
jgi:hypothetical protein